MTKLNQTNGGIEALIYRDEEMLDIWINSKYTLCSKEKKKKKSQKNAMLANPTQ